MAASAITGAARGEGRQAEEISAGGERSDNQRGQTAASGPRMADTISARKTDRIAGQVRPAGSAAVERVTLGHSTMARTVYLKDEFNLGVKKEFLSPPL